MSVSAYIRCGTAVLFGLFWTPWVLCVSFFAFFKNPKEGWSYKERKERPQCLQSTEVWTHHLVSLQHDGIKLHYVSAGSAHKPLMIFVHGFPEIWFSWRHQLKYFKDHYRVVAVSLRGYGDSDAPKSVEKYKIDLLVDDIKGLINSLGVKDCVLVGHDWGGGIAWEVATVYPELINRLIILNCPHILAFQKLLKTSWKQFLKSWYMFFFQLPYLPEYIITRRDFGMIRALMKEQYHIDNEDEQEAFLYYFSQKGALTGPVNFYRAAFRYGRTPLKRTLNMPVLIIWGTDDLALDESLAALSAEYCSNVSIKKLEGNHFIQQDKPDEVNAFMEEFLQSS